VHGQTAAETCGSPG